MDIVHGLLYRLSQNIVFSPMIEIVNQITMVKLTRPDKHNALDMPMFYAIDNTIKNLINNRNIRAIIVSGEDEDFCSGLDIKSVMSSPLNAVKLLF